MNNESGSANNIKNNIRYAWLGFLPTSTGGDEGQFTISKLMSTKDVNTHKLEPPNYT